MKKNRFNYGENSQKQEHRFGGKSTKQKASGKSKMSGEEKFKLVTESINSLSNAFNSFAEFAKEKEITKRKKIEQGERIKELDNDLEKTLSAERIEIEKIQSDFKLNYKTLENESEHNQLQARVIEKILDRVDNLTVNVSKYENEYGFDHPIVVDYSNKLHEQSITLTNLLKLNS